MLHQGSCSAHFSARANKSVQERDAVELARYEALPAATADDIARMIRTRDRMVRSDASVKVAGVESRVFVEALRRVGIPQIQRKDPEVKETWFRKAPTQCIWRLKVKASRRLDFFSDGSVDVFTTWSDNTSNRYGSSESSLPSTHRFSHMDMYELIVAAQKELASLGPP